MELVELSESECRRLLGVGTVGRLAVATEDDLVLVPVNYRLVGEAVVVRTDPGSRLGQLSAGARAVFEVDHLDQGRWRGWSVTASGTVEHLRTGTVPDVELPRPWAGGERSLVLRVVPRTLTGRRIGTAWDCESALEYRRLS